MNGKSHRALNSSIDEILNNNLRNNLLEEKKKTLDPVGKEDSDIDNDGDVDSNDEYLQNKRKKIGKAIKKVKTGRPNKPRKTINERKFEILNSLLSEMGGMDSHPFDAESGSDEFDSAMVHDHIEDHGGVPLTPENIKKHDIKFRENRSEDRTEVAVGGAGFKAPEIHEFEVPSGEPMHGMFPQSKQMGDNPYKQHPQFPGKRVYSSGIGDVISHYNIPEEDMSEGWKKSGYSKKKKSYSKKELSEAAVARINSISKLNKPIMENHPGIDRIR